MIQTQNTMLTCFEQRTNADFSACVIFPINRKRHEEQSLALCVIDGALMEYGYIIDFSLRYI